MNSALHVGHNTIKNGSDFLIKRLLLVSKSWHEQDHQLVITRKHYKVPLNMAQKGAWEFLNQLWTLLGESLWVDF